MFFSLYLRGLAYPLLVFEGRHQTRPSLARFLQSEGRETFYGLTISGTKIMATENIGIMKALTAKMSYLDQRQRVLAQNIANADTPNYQAHDLTKVDFSSALKRVTRSRNVTPVTTQALHLPTPGEIANPENRKGKSQYEIAPDKNAVILEEQIVKASKNTMDYNLMTSLYQKNVNMFKIALGGQ